MSFQVEFARFARSVQRGIRYHRLTYSGWLRHVKKMDVPWDQPKEEDKKLRAEYDEWQAQSKTLFSSTYNYVRTSYERIDKVTSENVVQRLSLEDAVKKLVSYMKRHSILVKDVCNIPKYQVALDLTDHMWVNSEAYVERDDTRRLSEDEYTEALVRIKYLLRERPKDIMYRKRRNHSEYVRLFRELVYKHKVGSDYADAVLQATFFGKVNCPVCHRRMLKLYNEDLKRLEWMCSTPEVEYSEIEGIICGYNDGPILVVDYETFVEMVRE